MNRKQRRAGNSQGNGSGSGDTRLDQAMGLHQTGRLMEADAIYRQILDEKPTHKDVLRLRGALAYQIGNAPAAAELLAEARKADPKNPEVLTLLGLALEGSNNPEGAEKAYRRGLALAPRSPEIWNNLGALLRESGKLEEAAEAFGRAVVLKNDYIEAYQNLGVTLYRMEKLPASLAAFEAGLTFAPDDMDLMLNYGVALGAAGRVEESATCFAKVLQNAPDDPDALTNLASAQMRLEDLDGAEETARQALAASPESAGAMANLAMILSAGRHFDEAEGLFHDALRAAPEFADIWSNYGNMLMAADRLDDAKVAYDHARKEAPGDARHAFQLGLCHLNMGEIARGWALYESGLDCGERVPVPAPKLERWRGENLSGKRLMIIPEQGLGDEIRNLSCLPDAITAAGDGGKILVGCDRRLIGLLHRAFPMVEPIAREEVANCVADVSIPVASLPGLFRSTLADFPDHSGYLIADPARVDELHSRLAAMGSGVKVGIAWRSGLQRLRSRAALTEIDQWAGVFATPGVDFINLQYGDVTAELDGYPVTQFEDIDLQTDIDSAAALTAACDLVINMGTSVGDMAGALGVPCWSLLLKPEWITLGADRHPFYPGTELFWRSPDEDWPAVLTRVAARLSEEV